MNNETKTDTMILRRKASGLCQNFIFLHFRKYAWSMSFEVCLFLNLLPYMKAVETGAVMTMDTYNKAASDFLRGALCN